jgi:hypothetical protein
MGETEYQECLHASRVAELIANPKTKNRRAYIQSFVSANSNFKKRKTTERGIKQGILANGTDMLLTLVLEGVWEWRKLWTDWDVGDQRKEKQFQTLGL